MALTISGTSNGKLGNLSLSANTGDILDSANTTFFGADQWYLNTNHTGDGVITAWTRVPATDGGGNIGSAMSVSSGIWTFPTTGIWLVIGNFTINATSTDNDNAAVLWEFSDDNFTSQFTNRAYAQSYVEDEGYTITRNTLFIFDCQDTSTHVLRIKASSLSGSNYFVGLSSSLLYNLVSFIRLGDT
jgi:hypothetical protein